VYKVQARGRVADCIETPRLWSGADWTLRALLSTPETRDFDTAQKTRHSTAAELKLPLFGVAPASFFGETVGERPDFSLPLTVPGSDCLRRVN